MAAVWAALKSGALDVATRELGVHIDNQTQAWLDAKRHGPKVGSPPVTGLVNAIIEARVADTGYAVVEIPIGHGTRSSRATRPPRSERTHPMRTT